MPDIAVREHIDIEAPSTEVLARVSDFHTWPQWSPWLYLEPDCEMSWRGETGMVGHGYDWQGKHIGSGGMTITRLSDKQIDCDLQFLKPFKSSAKVSFEIQPLSDDATRLTWTMNSHLPFFMFFMTASMTGMIRADYRRGLWMFKDLLELGKVRTRSEVIGLVDVQATRYVGRRIECPSEQIGQQVAAVLADLQRLVNTGNLEPAGAPFSISEKMDLAKGMYRGITALPVDGPVTVEPDYVQAERPSCKALKVMHRGPYLHLPNAWATLVFEARHRKLKPARKIPAFECYVSDRRQSDSEDPVTELYFPIRG